MRDHEKAGVLLEDLRPGEFTKARLDDGSEVKVINPTLYTDLTKPCLLAGTRCVFLFDGQEGAYWILRIVPSEESP